MKGMAVRSKGIRSVRLTAVALALGLAASSALANIIFMEGNHPQPDESNILFSSPESGTTITGEVDHTGVSAIFSTLTGETLQQKAQGQADIFNASGGNLTSMDFKLQSGYTFGDFILNLQNGDGTAHVVAIDNFNTVFEYDLGNGQNFLTMFAEPGSGESISEVQVTMVGGVGGWLDFKQPRISQVCSATSCVTQLPEPGTLLILGTTLLVVGLTGRRRT